jgi:hypothetical protein
MVYLATYPFSTRERKMSRRKLGLVLFGIVVVCLALAGMANQSQPVQALVVCSGVAEFALSPQSDGGPLKKEMAAWLSENHDYIVDSTVVLTEWSSGYNIYRPVSLVVIYHRADCR